MEGGSGVTGRSIDELHSLDMVKRKAKVVFLEVALMKFILGISKEIKRKVKAVFTRSIIDELHSSDIERD